MSTRKEDYYTPYRPKPTEPSLAYTQLVPFKYGHAKQIMVLKNDPHVSESIRLTGEFSPAEVRVFEKFIQPGDTVIDAGALYGEHTLPMAELVGPQGWVYAFEPQRIPFQVLCGNCQLNSMSNVTALQNALGTDTFEVRMVSLDPRVPQAWGMNRIQGDDVNRIEEDDEEEPDLIEGIEIDYLSLAEVSFIKIDVEGYEPRVLRGAATVIAEIQPVLYIEYQENQDEIRELLDQFEYDSLYLHKAPADPRDTGVPMLLALPPGKEVESEWLSELGFERI